METRPIGDAVTATLHFTFDGVPLTARPGDTIGAALTAAGEKVLRRTRLDKPRGLHCGMGACFDCLVTIDGALGFRACLAKVTDGMRVE
ncbi:MAG: (2Fe-2S)-binding protein, partial [Alphaproteobacteria bacterium]